jgi:ABC-2 type transport system ATP-binding protein
VVINHGRLVTQGDLESLLGQEGTRVVVGDVEAASAVLTSAGLENHRDDGGLVVKSVDGATINQALARAGLYAAEIRPERSSLETVFLGMTGDGSET